DPDLQALIVADSIRRGALTNDKGEFEMDPLGPGEYQIKPDEYNHDPIKQERTIRRLPTVFIAQKVTIKEGETPDPIEVAAVPTVTIEAQYLDSKGKPTRGHECFIFGRLGNDNWFGQGRPDADGKIVAHVPHGLSGAQMDLMTNEHGVLRHRRTA